MYKYIYKNRLTYKLTLMASNSFTKRFFAGGIREDREGNPINLQLPRSPFPGLMEKPRGLCAR